MSKSTRKLASAGLVPRTRLARFTLYLSAIELLIVVARQAFLKSGLTAAANSLAGWTGLLGFVLAILFLFLGLRWFRRHVMWSVRNRLIVTYLFIGGVPVTLAVVLALGTGYLAMEHVATFLAVSQIKAQEERLGAANVSTAEQMATRGRTPEQIMAADTVFPGRTITTLPGSTAPLWLKQDFSGLVYEGDHLYLRAANFVQTPKDRLLLVSSVPVDQKFLTRIADGLGSLTLYDANIAINTGESTVPPGSDTTPGDKTPVEAGRITALTAGSIAAPANSLDRELKFGGLLQATDWASGGTKARFLAGSTRLSTIYSRLTASMGIWTGVVGVFLLIIAIMFAIVILVALIIGIRLTRTITYSVANLYKATQHINRGEFDHRIQVRERDQLAALQIAFNSMTESIQRLILEQKEKERLQSELEIAHEVQAQLFPPAMSGTETLELHGICRPARTVSGDYYDFLSYGPDQMGIAVGDISGKGISAALLMATIHSAVRAYEQEQLSTLGAAKMYATGGRTATLSATSAQPAPARMLRLLNHHLFQSTQPEKYATLFLGFYDGERHQLTYSNAGHLAPIILGRDGSVRRLEAGGMVVGLFDNMEYEEETVAFQPGDIFIAFSDGMTEPENEFGEFGEQRLMETIAANRDLPLERISAHAVAAVQDWIGSVEQPDDITLVLARRIS